MEASSLSVDARGLGHLPVVGGPEPAVDVDGLELLVPFAAVKVAQPPACPEGKGTVFTPGSRNSDLGPIAGPPQRPH